MKIDQARPQHLQAWLEMRLQLWPGSEAEYMAELEAYFSGRSTHVLKTYVIEDQHASAVGFIELNIRDFVEGSRSSPVAYVEGWFVRSEYRGQGWGKRLMQQAEHWALAQGCSELGSDAELANTRSIAAHRALGFKETERVVCFLKQLSGRSAD